jgi:maltose O-acetyltransferase
MKIIFFKICRKFCLFIINNFFSTTNFFYLKNILLKISGISVGKNSKIVGPIRIGTVASLKIGNDCWIGSGLNIYGNGNVAIGDRCDLAPDISFVTGSHEIGDTNRRAGKGISYSIEVSDGCWIGARATIVGNIKINTSSIVGASSLVNKNVLENTIVGGVPAKVIKVLES